MGRETRVSAKEGKPQKGALFSPPLGHKQVGSCLCVQIMSILRLPNHVDVNSVL